jgi:soluble lytic murein transglycosylase-like protein
MKREPRYPTFRSGSRSAPADRERDKVGSFLQELHPAIVYRPARRPRLSARARRLLLLALFAAAGGAIWVHRVRAASHAPVVVAPAAAPLVRTPVPEARRVGGTERLEVGALSAVWEAPPLPPSAAMTEAPARRAPAAALPGSPDAELERWVTQLSRDQRIALRAALERMGAFESLVQHALWDRGLPGELIYLALIESEFLPTARSPAGAVGIWQFMPATARSYGLEVSEYVDERRDPVRSTYAAARHLQWLHGQFGSWHLALAAYNAGDARVGSTLRNLTGRWQGNDLMYWLPRPLLPAETQAYVPKLLAASRIARAPERYGFANLSRQGPLRFRELSVPGGTSLEAVAAALNVSADTVRALNPHLIRDTTPPGRRWPVRVPADLDLPTIP